jgi:hypothetical protein
VGVKSDTVSRGNGHDTVNVYSVVMREGGWCRGWSLEALRGTVVEIERVLGCGGEGR